MQGSEAGERDGGRGARCAWIRGGASEMGDVVCASIRGRASERTAGGGLLEDMRVGGQGGLHQLHLCSDVHAGFCVVRGMEGWGGPHGDLHPPPPLLVLMLWPGLARAVGGFGPTQTNSRLSAYSRGMRGARGTISFPLRTKLWEFV